MIRTHMMTKIRTNGTNCRIVSVEGSDAAPCAKAGVINEVSMTKGVKRTRKHDENGEQPLPLAAAPVGSRVVIVTPSCFSKEQRRRCPPQAHAEIRAVSNPLARRRRAGRIGP